MDNSENTIWYSDSFDHAVNRAIGIVAVENAYVLNTKTLVYTLGFRSFIFESKTWSIGRETYILKH
jgi:hypothetical protein